MSWSVTTYSWILTKVIMITDCCVFFRICRQFVKNDKIIIPHSNCFSNVFFRKRISTKVLHLSFYYQFPTHCTQHLLKVSGKKLFLARIFFYSVQMPENMDQRNHDLLHFWHIQKAFTFIKKKQTLKIIKNILLKMTCISAILAIIFWRYAAVPWKLIRRK